MRRSDDEEWVLDAFPQLVSLKICIFCLHDEADEDDDDHDGIIRSVTLELPSLELLQIRDAHKVKKCTLTCPKLVDIEFDCWRMVTLKFDGGARLHRLESKSRLPSSCNGGHKKQVILCVCIPFIFESLFIRNIIFVCVFSSYSVVRCSPPMT